MKRVLSIVGVAALIWCPSSSHAEPVRVGSKKFTESVILGEIVTLLARHGGAEAAHSRELGGTRLLWNALLAGEIDVYPEYTGTLREEIFAGQELSSRSELEDTLSTLGITMSEPLGFNNAYAIGMTEARASMLGIKRVSDLRRHVNLRYGFGNEFMHRNDGWPGLRNRYGLLASSARGLDHDLAYRALVSGEIDVTDLYATDAEIDYYGLRVLDDDLAYFPAYEAVLLYNAKKARGQPRVFAAVLELQNRIGDADMRRMNADVKIRGEPETDVAAEFASDRLGVTVDAARASRFASLGRHTAEHLVLVGTSLSAAIAVAIPLGIVATKFRRTGRIILAVTGLIQTIPSLALLVFMIPLLGIGGPPAVVALFLYSLLPIVRNTHAGLTNIATEVLESAQALGLPSAARLRLIELPLASRSILAGIKTSAVINVGTATLGALVGAGGYGQPILTGIRLDDTGLILQGAIPAAALALFAQWSFDFAERRFVPRGLRLQNEPSPR